MKSSKILRKSFEESIDHEVCNFNTEISEVNNSERKLTSISMDRKLSTNNNNNKAVQKRNNSRNSRNSRNSTKESPRNLSISIIQNNKNNNNSLSELVVSLKQKINIYESEIRSLIDEKIQMQIQINNLQMNNLKKSSRSDISGSSSNRKVGYNDIAGLNKELRNMGEHIARQKKLIESNNTILDETLGNMNNNDYYSVSKNLI